MVVAPNAKQKLKSIQKNLFIAKQWPKIYKKIKQLKQKKVAVLVHSTAQVLQDLLVVLYLMLPFIFPPFRQLFQLRFLRLSLV